MIGKQTVNTTLSKGHHAQTRHTARNFLIFSHHSSTPIRYTLLFLTGEGDYSQDQFPAIQQPLVVLQEEAVATVVFDYRVLLQICNPMLSLQEEAEATVVFDWENGYAECSAKDNINIQVR